MVKIKVIYILSIYNLVRVLNIFNNINKMKFNYLIFVLRKTKQN